MAFAKRTWIARDVQYPGRRILTATGNTNEWDVTRSEGIVNAEGDMQSAENLNDLENRIAAEFLNKLDANIISSGSFTPTLYGAATAGNPTYTTQIGTWKKIGSIYLLKFSVGISAKGGAAGSLRLGGLPDSAQYGIILIAEASGVALPNTYALAPSKVTTNYADLQYSFNSSLGTCDVASVADNFTINYGFGILVV